jgi:S-methyl-5-thioribose-1-phosphate isomerase
MATTGPAVARPITSLRLDGDTLWAIDQARLPFDEVELPLHTAVDVAAAIKRLAIRGAPLIGVAAAYGLALELARDPGSLEPAAALLREARPPAVNLAWAVDRVSAAARRDGPGGAMAEARAIEEEERTASAAMATAGADLLTASGVHRVLTHCNTGALAAPGGGTALGVIAELGRRGELDGVIATESRPLLQGARLTVYELRRLGIEHELIVDSAAAGLLAAGAADAVVLGCDRVAANGDVANKVGTYSLALAAQAAGIPFIVAGPTSTIDPACPSGADIVIEERPADEVRSAMSQPLTFPGTRCRNPAFDVTPAALTTALVTERGVARPPTHDSIAAVLGR